MQTTHDFLLEMKLALIDSEIKEHDGMAENQERVQNQEDKNNRYFSLSQGKQ